MMTMYKHQNLLGLDGRPILLDGPSTSRLSTTAGRSSNCLFGFTAFLLASRNAFNRSVAFDVPLPSSRALPVGETVPGPPAAAAAAA